MLKNTSIDISKVFSITNEGFFFSIKICSLHCTMYENNQHRLCPTELKLSNSKSEVQGIFLEEVDWYPVHLSIRILDTVTAVFHRVTTQYSSAHVYSSFGFISNVFYLYMATNEACSSTPYRAHARTSRGCGYRLQSSAPCITKPDDPRRYGLERTIASTKHTTIC